jgi:hypothetical protein
MQLAAQKKMACGAESFACGITEMACGAKK